MKEKKHERMRRMLAQRAEAAKARHEYNAAQAYWSAYHILEAAYSGDDAAIAQFDYYNEEEV